jgi:hypothetical protein
MAASDKIWDANVLRMAQTSYNDECKAPKIESNRFIVAVFFEDSATPPGGIDSGTGPKPAHWIYRVVEELFIGE